MKTKNVFLASVAFVFAIGSAFASLLVSDPVYVLARRNQFDAPTCVQTNKSCTQTSTHTKICQVQITTDSGLQIAKSDGTFKTFKAGCSEVLYDDADVDQTGATPLSGTIFELANP
jgi:hypothetical protein